MTKVNMANYKGSTATSETWQRCYAISVMNVLDGAQLMQFHEQSVVAVGSQRMVQEAGTCHTEFTPGGEVPLLDLTTNEPTGQTVSHEAIYQILYSAYMQAALARDAERAARIAAETQS